MTLFDARKRRPGRPTVLNVDGTAHEPLTTEAASLMGVKVATSHGMSGLRRVGLPVLNAGFGGDGGGGGGGRGRGLPREVATYEPDDGVRIDAHVDGSTVARVNRGAEDYHGLDAFYEANPHVRTGEQIMRDRRSASLPRPLPSGGAGAGASGVAAAPSVPTMYSGSVMDLNRPRAFAKGTKGRPVPLGEAFIAGDPQADGKPNPEVIVPTAEGVHVLPLKNLNVQGLRSKVQGRKSKGRGLPRLAYGTGTGAADGGFVPLVKEHGLTDDFGRVDGFGRLREARDVEGQVLGFSFGGPVVPAAGDNDLKNRSTGGTTSVRPGLPRVLTTEQLEAAAREQVGLGNLSPEVYEQGMNLLVMGAANEGAVQEGFSRAFVQGQQARAAADRERMMNPEGITVGVSPRPALERVDVAPEVSREERAYDRMGRTVMRAARGNPRLAMALLDGRAEAMAEQEKRAEEWKRIQFAQGEINKRNAAGLRIREQEMQARADQSQVRWQQDLTKLNMGEAFRQIAKQQEREQAMQSFPSINPYTGEADQNYYRTGSGQVLPTYAPQVPRLAQMEGTNLAYPSDRSGADFTRPFEMVSPEVPEVELAPEVRMPDILGLGGKPILPAIRRPGQPAQYSQKEKPVTPKKVNRASLLAEIEKAEAILADANSSETLKRAANKVLADASLDLNLDGVPDAQQGAGAGGNDLKNRSTGGTTSGGANANAKYF